MTAQPIAHGPILRPRAEVEAFLAWYPTAPVRHDPNYLDAVVAALEWVLGQRPTAPVSRIQFDQPPSARHVRDEHILAYDGMRWGDRQMRIMNDLPPADEPYGLGYLTGAENITAWLTGAPAMATPDGWPWPQGDY